jgi:serine/threonine protein kinase
MALTAGTRLGPYSITAPLAAGGMGEVYRARDTKLDRDVAIKVLPDLVSHDPERLARFEREAKTLASLNHPNIAIVYGFEETQGTTALVMELVDGVTLAARIAGPTDPAAGDATAGRPIPLDECLPIARQIAEALEAAHEHGVVHRDLKPANVMVREDGTVKVLDFGLAKPALSEAGAGTDLALSQAPTLAVPTMTQAGMILGTAAYMSPEQAKGRDADKRSDIWAFGCVLYEMLTGARAFPGADLAETLAAVIKSEPDWTALPPDTPASVHRLLRRCLIKDRKARLADASSLRIEIDDA